MPVPSYFCEHKVNRATCLICFHKPKAAPPPKPPAPSEVRAMPVVAQGQQPNRYIPPPPRAEVSSPNGAQAPAQPQRQFKPPYSSTGQPSYSDKEIWQPPVHESLIDRLPSHPEAHKK